MAEAEDSASRRRRTRDTFLAARPEQACEASRPNHHRHVNAYAEQLERQVAICGALERLGRQHEVVKCAFVATQCPLVLGGSVGKPFSPVHVVSEDGLEVPVGESGELFFEGGPKFEYFKDPEKTASVSNERGWRSLGDMGYVDEDGYLYLTDRSTFMIVSGGVNIYPQEAEDLLITHPKVLDAAVFGIPDDDMGQSVKGVVQTVDPVDATDEFGNELLDWLRNLLAHYKCPRSISFEPQLPRTDTGKLYKQELVSKYSA